VAIGTDIFRVLYTFLLGTDGEVAETGFHVRWAHADPTEDANLTALATAANQAWVDGFESVEADFPTTVILDSTKVYHIVPGASSDGIAHLPASGDLVWAGTAGTSLPWEVSFCVTLETTHGFVTKPRRQRGRMYLPPCGSGVLDSAGFGIINSTKQTDLMSATLACLESMNNLVDGTEARVVVYSPTGAKTTDVVYVSSDRKLDSQRRRENRQLVPARIASDDLDA
jgi:hypothetical protein